MTKRKKFLLLCIIALTACGIRIRFLDTDAAPENRNPAKQAGHYDYRGVIHWHTGYSGDATGTYEEVAASANRQNVDFMIATEHNNLRALDDGREGWHGKTLILSGAEITMTHGDRKATYFLALGIHHLDRKQSDPEKDFVDNVEKQDGLLFLPHPRNPRWSWEDWPVDRRVNGQEILDMTDEFHMATKPRLATALFYYAFNRTVAWEYLFVPRRETLKGWDEITAQRPFVGIYAPDFHQRVKLWDGMIWRFPKVEEVLPLAHDHVITATPFTKNFAEDKKLLLDALRKGHVYVAIDMLSDATGFMFSARRGSETKWMGDRMKSGDGLTLHIRLPGAWPGGKIPAIHLYRNGVEIALIGYNDYTGDGEFKPTQPGTYRVEVTTEVPAFWGGTREMVWIYSNPIYVE